jgi:hypothetical protein
MKSSIIYFYHANKQWFRHCLQDLKFHYLSGESITKKDFKRITFMNGIWYWKCQILQRDWGNPETYQYSVYHLLQCWLNNKEIFIKTGRIQHLFLILKTPSCSILCFIFFLVIYGQTIFPWMRIWALGLMVFNITFNNISVISWRSVLLVEKTWVPGENHRPVASHWQTLSHNVVSSRLRHDRGLNSGL